MSFGIKKIPTDLGKTLAELRNTAGLNQEDIAKKIKMKGFSTDQSRVSRIEKGVVTPTEREIAEYLKALGTENAEAYLEFLKLYWEHLERPSFWHPQRDVLCQAEINLQRLESFKSQPQVSKLLINQAQMYGETLRREAKYLSSLKHSITFVGSIGVGKTTAVCKLTKLVISQESALDEQIVLETGAGGTTVCEVRIQSGDNFGILVEPQPEEEINKLIEDCCTILAKKPEGEPKKQQIEIPKETIRVLRNMTGLLPGRREGANGKKERFDPWVELISQCDDSDTLRLELLSLMKLEDRNRRKIWFEGTSDQTDFEWLKKKFADINCGREHEFPLPQRIDVVIPYNLFDSSCYELDIVDTKGVDGTANRPDIRQYIDDSRTLTVLCSAFPDAPNQMTQNLIEKLIETGSEGVLKERVILLLLPQYEQALAMKDDAGFKVETKEDGYDLKQEQVRERLEQKCNEARDMPVYCFNSSSDEPQQITTALVEELEKLRKSHTDRLLSAVQALDILIKNQEEENARKAQQEVIKLLKLFVARNRNLQPHNLLVHEYLLSEMYERHPRKIWATTRRKGNWNNLNVYFWLGNGSRTVAWNRSREAFWGLKQLIKTHMGDPNLKPVHNFLEELLANWEVWYEEFLKSAQQEGEQIFKPGLKDTFDWERCAVTYGLEVEFTKLVITRLRFWFEGPEQNNLHHLLNTRMEKLWHEKVLNHLDKLTDEGTNT